MFEDRAVSEDFGNDSNYGENDTPGKKFGDTINEVPHNDPKGRDEFHFKSRTIYSQASETKPERSKGPSRPILKEIDFTPKGPDETRSEALPKNKTSSGLLPSISKPTVTAVAMNPKTMEKIQDFGFQGRPSVTTKEDFHVEPTGGEQTAEVRMLRQKPKSDKKSHVEASKPTIRDFIVEPRQIDVKDSSGQIEKERFQDKPKSDKLISKEASKPTIKDFKIEPRNIEAKESTGLIDLDRMEAASIPATAPRPTSALQAEGKTSYMSVKRNPKPQLYLGSVHLWMRSGPLSRSMNSRCLLNHWQEEVWNRNILEVRVEMLCLRYLHLPCKPRNQTNQRINRRSWS